MVQWLRLCTPGTGDPGSIPAQQLDSACLNRNLPHAATKRVPQLRPSAAKQINDFFFFLKNSGDNKLGVFWVFF